MRSDGWDELDGPLTPGPRPPREPGGRSQAGCTVAVVLGLIVFALVALSTMVDGGRPKWRLAACEMNVKLLQQAALMYEKDYSRLPDGSRWCDEIMPYGLHEGVFRCPSARGPSDYAINSAVAGISSAAISQPAAVPSIFDAASGWNQQGGAADVVFRHKVYVDYASMAFVDGRAKWVDASAIAGLTWTPTIIATGSTTGGP